MTLVEFDKLADLPFFVDLSEAARQALMESASLHDVPAGEVLLKVGELPDDLIILVDGLVQLMDTVDEYDATILLLKPVTCFITAAVLRNEPILTTARTAKPSLIVRIPAPLVRTLFANDPSFTRALASDLSLNYRHAIRELKSMRMRTGFQRLVAWILAMLAKSPSPNEIQVPFNKALLASRLGISPETLSRDLARLAQHGVSVEGRVLRVTDTETLRKLVREDILSDPPLP